MSGFNHRESPVPVLMPGLVPSVIGGFRPGVANGEVGIVVLLPHAEMLGTNKICKGDQI